MVDSWASATLTVQLKVEMKAGLTSWEPLTVVPMVELTGYLLAKSTLTAHDLVGKKVVYLWRVQAKVEMTACLIKTAASMVDPKAPLMVVRMALSMSTALGSVEMMDENL